MVELIILIGFPAAVAGFAIGAFVAEVTGGK